MKLFQIDDPREVVPIGCRLLKLFGLGRDEKLKLLYWVQCVFYLVFSIIPRVLVQIDDTIMLLRLGSELAFVSYLYCQILGLYFRRSYLYRLVDLLQTCINKQYSESIDQFVIKSNTKINKLSVTCCKYFTIAYVLYCAMPPIASTVVYVRNQRNKTAEPEEFIISSEMKCVLYYLNIRFNLLHFSFYTIVICLLTITSAGSLCIKDIMDVAVIKTTCLLFQTTAMQIRELKDNISQAQLSVVIKSHRDTLLCAQYLQEALNLSLLFQLTFCSLIWCLMMFYILLMGFDSRILNVLILLLIVTVETYTYCTLGTQLTDKGEEVLMALQQLAWYDQSIPIQKQLLFMIRRSQKPIILSAGKIFYANVLQFSEMVQKSYSFYLVLKNVF
ncbi:AGAP009111-PA [Anopheles gambiae str. PEST]|uniref:AGAP009111-PA n=1 Tax=Anopheles gambiae TaxID=7165 RepID=Q7PW29_ANOGA|nr:AGAP009111-PA [Anopheles gambiae str. PEST]